MDSPSMRMNDFIKMLQKMATPDEREEALLEELERMTAPRTGNRTQKIARAIIEEYEEKGPALINMM